MFNNQISNKINKSRNIKNSSLQAYINNLQKILKLLKLDINLENLDKALNKPNDIINLLKNKKVSTIRNFLASIVVYLSSDKKNDDLVKKYRELMDKYQKQNNEEISNNKKTQSQTDNWVSLEKLQEVVKNYKKKIDIEKILKKDELNKNEFDLLQRWVVGNLYIGDEQNPPIRNSYSQMQIISDKDFNRLSKNDKTKNYLVVKSKNNKFFSLGDYKTSDKYGTKEIIVGKKLNKVLNHWLKYNKSKNLLLNSKNEQMTPNSLTKYLQKVFESTGKNISSSIIRSIYISHHFPPQTKERNEMAEKMLHSTAVQSNVYAKN